LSVCLSVRLSDHNSEISACMSVFFCPIITQGPLDQFASNFDCTYLNTSSPGGASVRIEEHCSQVQDDLFHSVCALDIRYNTKEMFILNNF